LKGVRLIQWRICSSILLDQSGTILNFASGYNWRWQLQKKSKFFVAFC